MAKEKEMYQFSGRGEIYSYTSDYTKLAGFPTPRIMAWVKLAEGPLVTTQLTDLEYKFEKKNIDGVDRMVKKYKVEIGMPVEMVTRKLRGDTDERGVIVYGYKFRPVLEGNAV